MAQEGYDTLMDRIDSRYRLSMVTGRRAAQLKKGVPSTLTHKPITRGENAVSVAMKELERGSGVRWDGALPSAAAIGEQVQRDVRAAQDELQTYSVLREDSASTPRDGAF